MTNLYSDIADYINNRKYTVLLPNYTTKLPSIVEAGIIPPVYEPLSPVDLSMANVTLNDIVQLFDKHDGEVTIRFIDKHETMDMYIRLHEYIEALMEYDHLKEAEEYLVKARRLLNEIYVKLKFFAFNDEEYTRRMNSLKNTFDEWLEQFGGNVDITNK